MLTDTLKMPQWLRDLSPFEHVPALPAASFENLLWQLEKRRAS